MNGPVSPGSAITRSAGMVRPSAVRRNPPLSAIGVRPVWSVTPRSRRGSSTASVAAAPKTSSGCVSGVTSATSGASRPRERSSTAAMIASS